MMQEQNNKYLTDMIAKCTNCGNCRIICPAFKFTGDEIYSTRGRINLIKGLTDGELHPTKEINNLISVCLNCRQCADLCPADVEYFSIVKFAKNKNKTRNKFFDFKSFFIEGFFSKKPETADMFFSAAGLLRKLIYKDQKLNYFGNLIRRSVKLRPMTDMPEIPKKNFFNMKVRHELKGGKGMRAALFTGCGGKYLYPEAADRFVKILRSQGIETIIPKDQVCCGNPLAYKGLLKRSENDLKANAEAFNQLIAIKCIVTLCPGAAVTFKERIDLGREPKFRLPVMNWIDFFIDNDVEVIPEYENSIIFHSCPKCGSSHTYETFIKRLYSDHTEIPAFSNSFCGSTELLDRSNPDLRDLITRSFCDNNNLKQYSYIACSSFECAEHLNAYFLRNNMSIRAIHFVQALKY